MTFNDLTLPKYVAFRESILIFININVKYWFLLLKLSQLFLNLFEEKFSTEKQNRFQAQK